MRSSSSRAECSIEFYDNLLDTALALKLSITEESFQQIIFRSLIGPPQSTSTYPTISDIMRHFDKLDVNENAFK